MNKSRYFKDWYFTGPFCCGILKYMAKIFGWILLAAGVLVILGTLFQSFNIFTGKAQAPEIFKVPATTVSAPTQGKTPTSIEGIQQELGKMLGEQLRGMLPADTLPKILNLSVWSILAGLLMFGGTQISSLGIRLLK